MKKLYGKLILSVVTVLFAISVVLTSTYAWMSLSRNPAASNIQVTISGGKSILIAPDLTVEENGQTVHFPGSFTDSIDPAQQGLTGLAGLLPVSTQNGIDWVLPDYYKPSEAAVQNQQVLSGLMKDVSQFPVDSSLQYANLPVGSEAAGNYICLDFWVVSPGMDYSLRVSCEANPEHPVDSREGSYVFTRPRVVGEAKELYDTGRSATASVRVGFLVNGSYCSTETVNVYRASADYSDRYEALRGVYPEKGTAFPEQERTNTAFSVYEPNADLHADPASNGKYIATSPLAVVNGIPTTGEPYRNLAIQKTFRWRGASEPDDPAGSYFAAMFDTYKSNHPEQSSETLEQGFYSDSMSSYLSDVIPGSFFARSSDVYASLTDGAASAEVLDGLDTDGADHDAVIVQLQKDVPQRIRLFLWLEGQDADCVNPTGDEQLRVRLELAGSNT